MRIVLCLVAVIVFASSAYAEQSCSAIKGKTWAEISVRSSDGKILVDLVPKVFERERSVRVDKRKNELIVFSFMDQVRVKPQIPVLKLSEGVAHEDALGCSVTK